jgi:hypothetical protein
MNVRRRGSRFEVPAGEHLLVVRLAAVTRYPPAGRFMFTKIQYSDASTLCVSARPKHRCGDDLIEETLASGVQKVKGSWRISVWSPVL